MKLDYQGKCVLITGGSSGIGLALAKQLAAQGANVWILARRLDALQKACAEIEAARRSPDQRVGYLQGDIADREQIVLLLEQYLQDHGAPDILVSNAGITYPAMFSGTPFEVFDEIMQVNYLGTVNVLHTVLPAMAARRMGNIVIVGSVAGFMAVPGYAAYSASKFALRALADTLRLECKQAGVQVHYVAPSDTQTPQLEYENQFKPEITRELSKGAKIMTAEHVASSVLRGMARGRYMIIPGSDARLYYNIIHAFGLFYPILDTVVNQAWKKVRRSKSDRGQSD